MSKRCHYTNGFTYIELLLYMAIFSLMIGTLIPFAWGIITNGAKSTTQQEISSNARYASERIKYEMRNALDVNTATSNFGINLATDATKQLSLKADGASDPTIINVLNGKIQIKKGTAAPVPLTSNDITVTDLTFTNNTSTDLKTKNISFILTLQSGFNGAGQEYKGTISLRSSAEVRTN